MTWHTEMQRREALKAMILTTAGSALGARSLFAEDNSMVARPGLQLYTVRSEMQKSVDATLARLAQIGYKELEFAGYYGKTPAQVAAQLKANGLTAPSAHIPREMMSKAWDKTLDDAAAIGHQWVVIPYLQEGERKTADQYKALAAEMNVAAAAAKKRGINFAYHNHDFEFIPFGSTNGFEILMKECDPKLVMFELDLFWTTKAGKDATALMTQHSGRFPLVHVKDMKADGTMTEVGSGTIPFQKIFAAAKGGIKHFFVEHDNPSSPFESVTRSLATLQGLTA